MHSKSRNCLLSAAVAAFCIALGSQIGHAAQTYEYDFTNGNLNPRACYELTKSALAIEVKIAWKLHHTDRTSGVPTCG